MDLTICQNEQNRIFFCLSLTWFHHLYLLCHYLSEISGAIELDSRECLFVKFNHTSSAFYFRVRRVSVKWETVINLLLSVWDASKAVHWERFICIVDFYNRAYWFDGFFILVFGSQEMKRVWLRWFSVWFCEIYGNTEVDLETTLYIMAKGTWFLDNIKEREDNTTGCLLVI